MQFLTLYRVLILTLICIRVFQALLTFDYITKNSGLFFVKAINANAINYNLGSDKTMHVLFLGMSWALLAKRRNDSC